MCLIIKHICKDSFFEFSYFRNLSMVSDDVFNLVTAHKPAPISFTLAPQADTHHRR